MKQLKDTKIGQIIKEKAPKVFEVAKNLLPDKGLLGVVKNLVSQSDLSKEDKEQIHQQLVELYELEVKDRDSARNREVQIAQSGRSDWMMNITGVIGLACFVFIIYAVVYIPQVLENELFIHLMGMVEGVVIGNIFAFYYGTSSKK
tara:strand:+ start:867 stop:1304 length:438 start_codon:yes stop_codon:yes gene_type:complete